MTGMTRSNEIHFTRDSVRRLSSIFLSFGLFLIALNVHGTTLWAQVLAVPENAVNTSPMDSMPAGLPTYIILDDPKQMGELFKRLSKPDFQLLRPSSVVEPTKSSEEQPGFIRSMQINGRVEGNTVSLRLYYEIDQIKPGKVWTKIGLDGISLQSISCPIDQRNASYFPYQSAQVRHLIWMFQKQCFLRQQIIVISLRLSTMKNGSHFLSRLCFHQGLRSILNGLVNLFLCVMTLIKLNAGD